MKENFNVNSLLVVVNHFLVTVIELMNDLHWEESNESIEQGTVDRLVDAPKMVAAQSQVRW